ncbi:MAG: anaerobic ribonucleoside-triphosphate reductase activating protein [Clostridiales bacterium]|nr:anaerobic ribonucleoside-triphosphate reductase activating protein [Clostridiales bacterium]MCF8021344.1 anaerobic ribonucleoside-triphosphate reductase activating protein [Clostridiales bacterium]
MKEAVTVEKIRIASIIGESVVDGPGFRTVVFTQGCPRHCPGCHNPELLPAKGGELISPAELAERVEDNITPLINGVTFSGGDPLMQPGPLHETIKILRKGIPELDIWVYTGYLYEEVKELSVMEGIDVLVDGPFEQELKDITLPFKGSENQRIIDIPASRNTCAVVEWERNDD